MFILPSLTECFNNSFAALEKNLVIVLVLMLLAVLATLGNSFFINRTLSKRVALLSEGAQTVGSGNRGQQISIKGEDELRQLNAELEERVADLAARLRQMETFTYSVSHGLKTPLHSIDGYSRLLLEDYSERLDEEGRTFLNNIRQAAEQMGRLIEGLLIYSRMECRAMASKKVHPLELLQSLLAERAGEITAGNVRVTVDMPDIVINADPEGLKQVLRNLLDNALKFTGKAPDPHIEIGGEEKEKSCLLWMRDNGIGFDMQYHDRIFGIFQRLQKSDDFSGMGIGLAVVHMAMQRMGGKVWAESTPGMGSTFYMEMIK